MTSNDDDTVTVRVGAYIVRVQADTWRDAADLAHTVAALVNTEDEIRTLKEKLMRMAKLVDELAESIRDVVRAVEKE